MKESLFVEKRFSQRYSVPRGTRVLFKNGNNVQDFAYVDNISGSGMLICDYFPAIRYQVESVIDEIYIFIPQQDGSEVFTSDTSIDLGGNHGRIVRCLPGNIPYTYYYGISFAEVIPMVEEKLANFSEYARVANL